MQYFEVNAFEDFNIESIFYTYIEQVLTHIDNKDYGEPTNEHYLEKFGIKTMGPGLY